ncbi:hypothetical protein DB88DRAFT_92041 [Papiliotrema laurentii]|uniref:Sister chromatid cohesion protein n=1 Tax=Papiliotrema laurentii TaxID=5418 RepID=A0AAD9CUP1_PAPLA|nr:hypothetical protein DB88DRAFT_92041 [Papiliotrema laurentii]
MSGQGHQFPSSNGGPYRAPPVQPAPHPSQYQNQNQPRPPPAHLQSHPGPSTQSPSYHQQPSSSSQAPFHGAQPLPGGIVYDDPTNLLRVYPFITYQPTARAAMHFSPHTAVSQPMPSASEIYPQHAEVFQRIDQPRTAEDWAMRNTAEARVRGMLNSGNSYMTSYNPRPPDSSSFISSLPPYPTDNPALPYHFLPSYLPQPMSAYASHNVSAPHPQAPAQHSENGFRSPTESMAYLDQYISSTLQRQAPSSGPMPAGAVTPTPSSNRALPPDTNMPMSGTSTPGLASAMARTVLTPEASPGPSPTKKQKLSKPGSPSLRVSSLPNPPPPSGSKKSTVIKLKIGGSQSQPSSTSSLTSGGSTPTNAASQAHNTRPSLSGHAKERTAFVVEVPSRHVLATTESNSDDEDEEEEDDLDWEEDGNDQDGDWQMDQTSPDRSHLRVAPPPVSGRTGERDTRTHFQKFQTLLEDIFEENDSFSAEPTVDEVNSSRFFSGFSAHEHRPLLSVPITEKVARYVARIQRSKKRVSSERIEWDDEMIARILRLLERSLSGLETLNPFSSDKKAVQSKKKKGKAKKETEDMEPKSSAEQGDEDMDGAVLDLTEQDIREATAVLERMKHAGLAAECVLTILDTEDLSKNLLSEDLLSMAVNVSQGNITTVIIPVVEALSSEKIPGRFLEHVVEAEQAQSKAKRLQKTFDSPILTSIVQSASGSLPRITSLLARPDIAFSDRLVIQTVYLAIAPLFVSEPASSGRKKVKESRRAGPGGVMRSLRLECLACLRGVFARYEEQRQWIIEEILTSMGKASETSGSIARFQLSNGTSIHTITSLLLQLIQASSFGITKRIRRLRTATLNSLVGDLSGSTTPSERSDSIDEESRICSDRIESSLKSAKIVASYLVQRSLTGKSTKSSHDTDYKVVLDIFVNDLLDVLYRPEWPAAPLYLTVLSRILIAALEDRGTDNAVKGLALDYLGDIAAKLRWFHVEASKTPATLSLDEIISNADTVACADLVGKHQQIHNYLTSAAREDAMFGCSFDMSTLVWAQELHLAIKKSGSIVDKLAEEKDTEAQDTRVKLQEIAQLLKNTLRNAWTGDDNLFEVSDPNASNAANAACIAVSRGRPLQNAFGPILNALVSTMGVSLINLRSKALRGLGTIVTVDPDVLSHASVKQAIDERLSDSSAAVRDAAVELVGKYVVQKPSLAVEYYPHLALRVSDSGLAVRKRVIKLLKGIFGTTTEKDIKVDICCKMITLTGDTDENIQELAIKTVYEMIYPPVSWDKAATATLLVEVIAEYQGGAVVLEGGISQIVKECEKGGHEDRLVDTIDALIELLTDGTERHDFDPLSHIRAIFMLVLARADLIDVNKAEILLSYLRRKPANSDEQASNELLLKIFKTCIPSMPRVASSFATKLSEDLVPMISAPSGGFPSLKETVACFCAVANHLTRDYSAVMRILLSCESRTRAMRNEWNTTGKATQASSPAGPIFVFVCASLAEHCNFDALSETDATVKNGLQRISPDRPLYEHLFDACLDFTKMPIPQMAPSLCLGSLFRAYPVLILREEATDWMDGVFASNDTTTQARLLGVIHDFLLSEADKKAGSRDGKQKKKNEGKDVDALIGNAAELSESGLSTAVVQRNIQHILNGAKSQHLPTQSAALDILAFTVTQGLYHPLQCLPILISLETSENETVAERALDLHRMLHSKHSTLVNVRFLEFAKASYEYQRTLTAEVAGHRDGLALLSGWYSLIGEKRAWRHDFLKQLCRVFDYDLTGTAVPDVGLVLYICDNLATLEYKLQEEAMTVVSLLSGVVAQATGLVMVLENGTVEGSGSESVSGKRIPTAEAGETYSADVVIHSSILVTLALLIKNHLLDMYGLPEDKCIKHVPGKKTTVGDKPAVKRREGGLDLSRVSLVRGVTTVDDFKAQRTTFLELVHEDGTLDD